MTEHHHKNQRPSFAGRWHHRRGGSLSTKKSVEESINSPAIGIWGRVKTAMANGFEKREIEPKMDNQEIKLIKF